MLTLALDVGTSSIGWMVLDRGNSSIVDGGVYIFEVPETRDNSGKASSNRMRHGEVKRHKRLRARRKNRMSRVRRLLHEAGALPHPGRHAFKDAARRIAGRNENPSPWQLRSAGLRRLLTADEWAIVIAHLAGHRGYRSNTKQIYGHPNEPNDDPQDTGKVRQALRENDQAFTAAVQAGEVETVGEWLARNDRQRNRPGDYRFTIKREWVVDEARLLFARQRGKNNPAANASLEQAIIHEIIHQEEVRSKPVAKCTFEPDEDRAARHSYSFELFRLLQKLNNLKVVGNDRTAERLRADQIALVIADFGAKERVTYATLRKMLDLHDSQWFDGIPDRTAEKLDIFGRAKGKTTPGVSALRKVIIDREGESAWQSLLANRDTLDGIAAALAHHSDLSEIGRRLSALGLEQPLVETLLKEADGGRLGFFKGAGHLSVKALRKLEPLLLSGLDLHEAQLEARYDPSKDRYSRRPGIVGSGPKAVQRWLRKPQLDELVTSQTAARAVRETFRQVLDILRKHPRIRAIHLEMAREVGRSPDARREIELDQKRRAGRRENLREQFVDTFGCAPTDTELERWALYKEQLGKCPFSPSPHDHIECGWIRDGDGRVQIEHILPRSRFRNNAMSNKVLCLTSANQNKQNRTPYEWLSQGHGPMPWEQFAEKARIMFKGKEHKAKLRNLLLVDTGKLESKFKNRDLVDTRWIAKFLLSGLERLGTVEAPIQVQPVNAGLVGMLRYAWGLDGWKRDPGDKSRRRADDRHHALDAAIVGTIDRALVARLTRAYQQAEKLRQEFPARAFPPPWRSFRRDVVDFVYGNGAADIGWARFEPLDSSGIFVVRSESRRARGRLHKDTIYAVRREAGDKEAAVERLPLEMLTVDHLSSIRYGRDEAGLRAKLENWLAEDKPEESWPTQLYRDQHTGSMVERRIRRVTINSRHKPSLRIATGDERKAETPKPSVSRDGIVRVDVFRSRDGKHLCRPIYRAELSQEKAPDDYLSDRISYKLPDGAIFLLSLYKYSYVRVTLKNGAFVEGYYRNFDRDSLRLELWPNYSLDKRLRRRVTVGTIDHVEKLAIGRLGPVRNRLGEVAVICREERTWRPLPDTEASPWRGAAST